MDMLRYALLPHTHNLLKEAVISRVECDDNSLFMAFCLLH